MRDIIKKFEEILDTKVYAVGGCVRDFVMGIEPHDIDFASALQPKEVIKRFESKGLKGTTVGESHGTVLTILDEKFYEITTFRTDHNQDGRYCEVEFVSTIEEDLGRRDFTVNAMAMDSGGNIIDLYNGREDIEKGIIRTVGVSGDRFKEDYLRILRACRFANCFEFTIDESMLFVMRLMVGDILKHVSIERVKQEFDKAFVSEKPSGFIRLLYDIGFLSLILPEITTLNKIEQSQHYHPEGNAFEHTMLVLDRSKPKYRWAALLHDVGKFETCEFNEEKGHNTFVSHDKVGEEIVHRIAKRFKFSNSLRAECTSVCRYHMRPMFLIKSEKITKRAVRRFVRDVGNHMEAVKSVVIADVSMRPGIERLDIFDIEVEEQRDFLPLINGNHLIEMGLIPGPIFKEILLKLEDLQVEGVFSTVKEGLNLIKNSDILSSEED